MNDAKKPAAPYKSPKSYVEAYLRGTDKHTDPTGLNPLTLVYASHLQLLDRIAEALERQVIIAERTLIAIERTHAQTLEVSTDPFSTAEK